MMLYLHRKEQLAKVNMRANFLAFSTIKGMYSSDSPKKNALNDTQTQNPIILCIRLWGIIQRNYKN